MTNRSTNQGLMIYLSQNPCLEENAIKFYNTLISLQKEIGCAYKKIEENDPQFDKFIGQTYIKAMTDRNDGRTVVILGKDHHGMASQGYFDIDPDPYENKTGKGLGNLLRWGHLGDNIEDGILLVDFELGANNLLGVTRTPQEIQQLLRLLQSYKLDSKKQVYLTESSRIYEPEFGKAIRSMGIKTFGEWVNHEFDKVDTKPKTQITTKPKQKLTKKSLRSNCSNFGGFGGSLRSSSLW